MAEGSFQNNSVIILKNIIRTWCLLTSYLSKRRWKHMTHII